MPYVRQGRRPPNLRAPDFRGVSAMFISSPEKVVSTTDDMLRLRESAFAIDMFVVATTWVGLFDHLVASPGPARRCARH
ncbi:hypothetical protein ACFQ4K_24320 [Tistrella bauzanensis]